jgi:hypothetical protein
VEKTYECVELGSTNASPFRGLYHYQAFFSSPFHVRLDALLCALHLDVVAPVPYSTLSTFPPYTLHLVHSLGHDQKLLAFPGRFRISLEERLETLHRGKLAEHGTLEFFVALFSSHAYGVDLAVLCEELFKANLQVRSFVAEAFL